LKISLVKQGKKRCPTYSQIKISYAIPIIFEIVPTRRLTRSADLGAVFWSVGCHVHNETFREGLTLTLTLILERWTTTTIPRNRPNIGRSSTQEKKPIHQYSCPLAALTRALGHTEVVWYMR
jgi:hypothetical protein